MPQDIRGIIQFKHIDHEQVDEKQQAALRAKSKENLAKQNAESKKRSTMRRVSWSTKLSLRLSFTLKRKGCRDQEPGANGEEFN